jgi:hypothetical protein
VSRIGSTELAALDVLPRRLGHHITIGAGEPIDCTDLVVEYHRKAHERAIARERGRKEKEAAGWRRPAPMSGHREAMVQAAMEYGHIPAAFCGLPVPPNRGAVDFARECGHSYENAAANAANSALVASEDGAATAEAWLSNEEVQGVLREVDAMVEREWTGSPAQVSAWDEKWDGMIWVPYRQVRNRPVAEAVKHPVPAYLEGPFRARPRDYLWLTAEEALEEHRLTRQLYADITARVEDGMRGAEARVLEHRHAKGLGPHETDRS